jgi:NAD(P)H dehydrogenase (quinone)
MSLEKAFEDVTRLLFVASDGDARDVMRHHANVIDAAAAAGVEQVAFTSIIDVDETSPFYFTPVYRDAERRLAECGLVCTILRCGLYSDFLLSSWVPRDRRGDFHCLWDRRASRLYRGTMLRRWWPRPSSRTITAARSTN